MSRLAASFVLGYHGCEARVARKIINCEEPLRASDKKYDWLGPGTYFWESDPFRAMEWAQQAKTRGRIETPAVVGAVIDLGNCLDLLNRENIELVRDAHRLFVQEQKRSGLPIPANRSLEGEPERILRFLDRAVIQFLHEIFEVAGEAAFDSVRGLFPEGDELYPGAGFRRRNHIQIAVCNPKLILGLFYPPDYPPAGD
ncbi:hypothetical protein [Sphingomonas hankyongi]|uniref:DUF3990 domain-containing protein n=1 Tax=Sphingomonas hankyongi TaxID=2908209 RepID=A0ABT0S0J6_9SPHN|nr:hypothetical protein [Sphingomonas hankyongi]MCL6729251.1 hypothetical protein [Sphingomonas hankyongi]